MQDKTKSELISSEIAGLWTTYITDSLAICMMKFFMNRLEDSEIKPVIQQTFDLSNTHMQVIKTIYEQEGFPLPQGFNQEDVDINAPRLYSDTYYLFYAVTMSMFGMTSYAQTLTHISRPDLRQFFTKCLTETTDLYNKAVDVLHALGLFIKAPVVEFEKGVDFINDQNFFSGGFLGRKRPLALSEITALFASIRYNIIGGALKTGFAQVTKNKKLSDYFFRGRDLTDKKIRALSSILTDEKIPVPASSDAFVTSSTVAPFSDKLMLFQIVFLQGAKIAQDGFSIANVFRHDLQAYFSGSMIESAKYAEDGVDILVANKWMEKPLLTINHKELVTV